MCKEHIVLPFKMLKVQSDLFYINSKTTLNI